MQAIPKSICKGIELAKKGQKISPKRLQIKQDKILLYAKRNLNFLYHIAAMEPLYSFLQEGEKNLFIVHGLNVKNQNSALTPGHIILTVTDQKPVIIYWEEEIENNPFYSEQITEDNLGEWNSKNLRPLAELTDKAIWNIMRKWLRAHRMHLAKS